ncbi:MAG: DUF1801 domain-containing protein [Myxococcales bacterium]
MLEFLSALTHPKKAEINAVRALLLGASPAVREELKWNAPSFYTTEHFATFKLRPETSVQLVLHLGAKVRATAVTGIDVHDPAGLLKWLARDRALVTFSSAADVRARSDAFVALIREWLRWV